MRVNATNGDAIGMAGGTLAGTLSYPTTSAKTLKATTRAKAKDAGASDKPHKPQVTPRIALEVIQQSVSNAMEAGLNIQFQSAMREDGMPLIRLVIRQATICVACRNWCEDWKCHNPECERYGISQKPQEAQ